MIDTSEDLRGAKIENSFCSIWNVLLSVFFSFTCSHTPSLPLPLSLDIFERLTITLLDFLLSVTTLFFIYVCLCGKMDTHLCAVCLYWSLQGPKTLHSQCCHKYPQTGWLLAISWLNICQVVCTKPVALRLNVFIIHTYGTLWRHSGEVGANPVFIVFSAWVKVISSVHLLRAAT